MSEWNDALEAAAEICDMRSIPQGGYLTEMDIWAAECAIAIRALKRPEAVACVLPHCITIASCEKARTCLAEENRPTPKKDSNGCDI